VTLSSNIHLPAAHAPICILLTMSTTMCRAAAVFPTVAAGARSSRRLARSRVVVVRAGHPNKKSKGGGGKGVGGSRDTGDVDWAAKTKELTADRVMEKCMDAMASGDETLLESCLLELEEPAEKTAVLSDLMKKKQDDAFWQKKLSEIAAERVLDNCMTAVVRATACVARPS